jgi:hypothetical protein
MFKRFIVRILEIHRSTTRMRGWLMAGPCGQAKRLHRMAVSHAVSCGSQGAADEFRLWGV